MALFGCAPEGDVGRWSAREDAGADDDDAGFDAEVPTDAGCGDDDACASSSGDAGAGKWVMTVVPGPTTSYFADGRALPGGIYTLKYLDGCWKSGVVAWTVNLGGEGYHVVGAEPERRIGMAPGTVGTFAGLGAYATYEECVTANTNRPGFTFAYEGGPLGLKLESLDPLTLFILLAGGETVGGRSPTFELTCSGTCR